MRNSAGRSVRAWGRLGVACCALAATYSLAQFSVAQVPTSLIDFFLPGTQPDRSGGVSFAPIKHSDNCRNCHDVFDPEEVPIYTRWVGSPMAQAARDPVFHAALAIANQDAAFAGDLCLRCHTPGGWLGGRSVPTDGSALIENDLDGVNCNFCHRAVDPVFKVNVSPVEDLPILTTLAKAGLLPLQPGGANYVVSPQDVRRGPLSDVPENYHGVPIIVSPFHRTSEVCATCHDVSNPAVTRNDDDSYALNTLGEQHQTLDKYDMFPLERTYSEWLNSSYANGGVDAHGVFGGEHPTGVMVTCQDCHMPHTGAWLSVFSEEPFFRRPDVRAHDFTGGNAWMQDLVGELYPDRRGAYLDAGKDRARSMLARAATMDVLERDCQLRLRITNETGHKLPTGYPEGRRMWFSVAFFDKQLNELVERGTYNGITGDLSTADTKVYEIKLGLDSVAATQTGLAAGPSFHFAVANKIFKDNRIPPRGFTNAAFEDVQAAPVAATYADGQYWDDTSFHIPPGAISAEVRLYYQTSSKDYIHFLRDENKTNDAGDVLYDLWEFTGMSPPVLMLERIVTDLSPGLVADTNCDGIISLDDYALAPDYCLSGPSTGLHLNCEAMDADADNDVDLTDFAAYQNALEIP